jgi:hypothetical protein
MTSPLPILKVPQINTPSLNLLHDIEEKHMILYILHPC